MVVSFILFGAGVVFAVIWAVLFLKNYNTYKGIIAGINDDDYFLRDIFAVGFAVIKIFNIDYLKVGKRHRSAMAEIYSRQYADFNLLATLGAQISYILTVIPIGCFIGAAAGEPIIALLFIFVGVFLALYMTMKVNSKVEARHDELLMELPSVLSKMALLVNVGTTFREAWRIAAESAHGVLGREMRETTQLIANGMPEKEAYVDFADRCKIQQIKKMVSIIIQNLEKGSSELVAALKEISGEAWTEKKNIARRLGENANNKLVFPMLIMFAGVMLMVLVPIMLNMNVDM